MSSRYQMTGGLRKEEPAGIEATNNEKRHYKPQPGPEGQATAVGGKPTRVQIQSHVGIMSGALVTSLLGPEDQTRLVGVAKVVILRENSQRVALQAAGGAWDGATVAAGSVPVPFDTDQWYRRPALDLEVGVHIPLIQLHLDIFRPDTAQLHARPHLYQGANRHLAR